MDAIIYTSNTGFTKHYAELLSEATGLPVHALEKADGVKKGGDVIYLGWLFAGHVKGYKKAAARYNVRALCAVGMGAPGSQPPESIKKQCGMPEALPVFYLQGGFDMKKLRGLNKFMMSMVIKGITKKLEEKPDRTAEEDAAIDMAKNGGDYVKPENLTDVLNWYRGK